MFGDINVNNNINILIKLFKTLVFVHKTGLFQTYITQEFKDKSFF